MDVIKYKMMYKIQKNKHNIRILGNEFIKNNRNKGKLIIKNKKQYFREFSHLEKINEKQLKIKMILSNNIYNLSYMFKECESLCRFSIYDKQKNIPEVNSINLVQNDYFSENGESSFFIIVNILASNKLKSLLSGNMLFLKIIFLYQLFLANH